MNHSKQKINYQKQLDRIIKEIEEKGEVPTLMLHSCCAPCSSYVLEYLSNYFRITDLYYNPNISPEEEYRKRVAEIRRLIDEMEFTLPVTFVEDRYDPREFYDMAKGLEGEPEGGERCFACFRLRLEEAARKALEYKCDYFCTTLTISPLKNEQKLNEIGLEIGEKYGVRYLVSDFKKKNGYKRSIELSREHDLYRQNFCGCVFSRMVQERKMSADQS